MSYSEMIKQTILLMSLILAVFLVRFLPLLIALYFVHRNIMGDQTLEFSKPIHETRKEEMNTTLLKFMLEIAALIIALQAVCLLAWDYFGDDELVSIRPVIDFLSRYSMFETWNDAYYAEHNQENLRQSLIAYSYQYVPCIGLVIYFLMSTHRLKRAYAALTNALGRDLFNCKLFKKFYFGSLLFLIPTALIILGVQYDELYFENHANYLSKLLKTNNIFCLD